MNLGYKVERKPGDCFQTAEFSFWCSNAQADKLKALIVITPGSGDDGRYKLWTDPWKKFVVNHNCGIIGVRFTDVHPKVDEDYIDAKNGSGRALLEAVDWFQDKLGKDDYPPLPLLLWGFSAGGEFNYEMACWAPKRVAAFVVNKGGIYYSGLAP